MSSVFKFTCDEQSYSVPKYILDTRETLRNRISVMLNIVPKYLHFISEDTIVTLQAIVSSNVFNMEWLNYFDAIDVLHVFVQKYKIPQLDITQFRLANEPLGDPQFNDIFYELESYPDHREVLRKLSIEQKKNDTLLKSIDSLEGIQIPQIDTSELITMVKCKCIYKTTLDSIFNRLHTGKMRQMFIPFITYNGYCKVANRFIPTANWTSSSNHIRLKYNTPQDPEYKDIVISVKDRENDLFIIEGREDILEVCDMFRDLILSTEVVENQVGGIYRILDTEYNYHLIQDALVSLPHLYRIISVNDNTRISERKQMQFIHPFDKSERCRVIMVPSVSTRTDPLPLNVPFIYVKILFSTSNAAVNECITLISKILHYSNNKKTETIRWYAERGFNIEPKAQTKTQKLRKVFPKDRVPEVFIGAQSQYSRKCQIKRQPMIISEEEAVDKEESRILRFPKDGDDPNRQVYECPSDEYPYAGIVPFDNKYQFAPCCFKTDQKGSKKYTTYFSENNKDVNKKRKHKKVYKITTNKVIEPNETGLFSKANNITDFLNMYNYDIKRNLVRYGIRTSPHSLLEAIHVALDLDVSNMISVRNAIVRDYRMEMLKQQMYDYTIEEIYKYMSDIQQWMDHVYVLPFLEFVYKCNIFVLEKDNKQIPSIPRYAYIFRQNERDYTNKPTIVLYKHSGSESDDLPYPHYEVVVSIVNDELSTRWKPVDCVLKRIIKQYNAWTNYDAYHSKEYNLENVIYQHIDDYGKTRGVQYSNGQIQKLKHPIAPLINVPFKLLLVSDKPSIMDVFIMNEKISRVLTNWCLYLFSKFINDNNIQEVKEDEIKQFINAHFVMNMDYKYNTLQISDRFILEQHSSVMSPDSKIICNSRELLFRLIYQLRVMIARNRNNISSYKDRLLLDMYYTNKYDYSTNDDEYLIYNIDKVNATLIEYDRLNRRVLVN